MVEHLDRILQQNIIETETITFSLSDLLVLFVAIIITTIVLDIIRKIITNKLAKDDKNKFMGVFQFIKYVVYVLIFMITMRSCGVDMSVFLTASAALFVGIGFALQTFFQDILSGILIILDQSLHIGDIIEIDNKVGEVQEIKLRTTRMITRNDKIVVIPNHIFMTESLFNWTQNDKMHREQISVGVAYQSDVDLVKEILIEATKKVDGILEDKPILVLFEDFGDSALKFSVYFYVDNAMNSPIIQSDIRFRINHLFKQNKIQIPFPQTDVHIKKF